MAQDHSQNQCQRVVDSQRHSSSGGSTSESHSNRLDGDGNSVSYTVFLYREELRRRNARHLRLSRTKITLTDKLISSTVRNIHACSVDDLRAVSREIVFKKKLAKQLYRICKLRRLGMRNPHPSTASTEL